MIRNDKGFECLNECINECINEYRNILSFFEIRDRKFIKDTAKEGQEQRVEVEKK